MVSDAGESGSRSDSGDAWSYYDRDEVRGWKVSADLRFSLGVHHSDALRLYLGVAGGVTASHGSGDVWEEDEEGSPEKVGTMSQDTLEWGVGPSLSAVHPLDDRLSVSGVLDLGVVSSESSTEVVEVTTADTPYVASSDDDQSMAVGIWPRVSIYLHIRL